MFLCFFVLQYVFGHFVCLFSRHRYLLVIFNNFGVILCVSVFWLFFLSVFLNLLSHVMSRISFWLFHAYLVVFMFVCLWSFWASFSYYAYDFGHFFNSLRFMLCGFLFFFGSCNLFLVIWALLVVFMSIFCSFCVYLQLLCLSFGYFFNSLWLFWVPLRFDCFCVCFWSLCIFYVSWRMLHVTEKNRYHWFFFFKFS